MKNNKTLGSKKNSDATIKKIGIISFFYVVIPALIMFFSFKYVRIFLIGVTSTLKVKGLEIQNSNNAIDNVITPFLSSITIIIPLVLSIFFLNKCIEKKLKREKYLNSAKKLLKVIEVILLLIGLVSVSYANANLYPYEKEPLKNETNISMTENKILEVKYTIENSEGSMTDDNVRIESLGLTSPNASIFYNVIIKISQIFYGIAKYFDFFIALAGAIIFPLKQYISDEKKIKLTLSKS